ncbi:metallopeptidase TldD-related protein [Actinophytocola oryzae]|uniref:Putative Zn-dependent protease n=1 Tax=Actinophytocola oryzae TaxID=502181 RepID=A0A4R7VKH2_9PSEU|nr:metallopeptidase TldD-related protein [Actinophytocola oryzae]TDV49962.1 putative Zn-dependent protease [Actinophytocola oryzae]
MTIDDTQVRAALATFGSGARLEVSAEQVGLLRFAHSRVTAQHSENRLRVRVRLERDGRVAVGSVETLEPDAVRAMAAWLDEAITALPVRPTGPRGGRAHGGGPTPREVSEMSRTADAAQRYAWFDTIRTGLGEGTGLGGSIRHEVVDRVVTDDTGLYRQETLTTASVQAVADRDGRSASVKVVHRDAGQVAVDGIADRLLDQLAPIPGRERISGTCRVVLRPQATGTLLATYGYTTLGAAGYAQGRTAVAGRLGEPVASTTVTIVDDGTDPDGLPSGFDVEGSPRLRTPLVTDGVVTGVVSNVEHADVTGGVSTGHGVPFGWRFGADPSPSHLFMAAGDASEEELLSGVGNGLVISRLDYLRVLHPKDTLVTGTTRDATYWVEDGKIVSWHPPVRFTFRMDEVLNAVLAVGDARERGDQTFMESVTAPAVLVDAGPLRL